MKNKLLMLLLFIGFTFICKAQNKSNYILIEYLGATDKPLPSFKFCTDCTSKEEYFVYTTKVSLIEYSKILKLTKQS